jgi:hypothetical protein
MSNHEILKIADQAGLTPVVEMFEDEVVKFAGLMMQECIDWLYFHGESEAAERLEWRRKNLGIK